MKILKEISNIVTVEIIIMFSGPAIPNYDTNNDIYPLISRNIALQPHGRSLWSLYSNS